MKIGFISADWSDIPDPETGNPTLGGAGWYRCGMPAKYLQMNGIETVVVELISTTTSGEIWLHDWNKECHDDCDILVFQRWMADAAPEVIKKARSAGQVIVSDLDDWYWGLDPRNGAFAASDPKANPDSNRNHYWQTLAASDYITCSTPYLAERLTKIRPEKFVIRNAIDLQRWEFKERVTDEPRVGWVGSTTHRSGDLETLKGVIGPFVERNGLKFVHAGHWPGSPTAGELAGVREQDEETHEIVSILDYPKLFENMEIGLVPLRQTPFNFAKSAIKGMEYAAAGVPFVAEATPEYQWFHDLGAGRVARKPSHWNAALKALLDPETRHNEAVANRAIVEQLDIEKCWTNWLEFYSNIAK